MKKLTLNAEPEVIDQARRLAEAQGTSVSSLLRGSCGFSRSAMDIGCRSDASRAARADW